MDAEVSKIPNYQREYVDLLPVSGYGRVMPTTQGGASAG